MNRFVALLCFVATSVLAEDLSPADFKEKLAAQNGLLLDVRTPAEVSKAKLVGASMIDFNGGKFEQKVALISRDKPVFVYCARGGRSAQAVATMEKLGFKKVYNLVGGIEGWKQAGLAVESGYAVPPTEAGTTPADFDAILKKEKRLLVDFRTQWCTPCQRMEPIVDSLKGVKVLKVDLDASEALGAREKIEGVPVFVLYVDGKERARLSGEQTADALSALLRK